MPEYSPEILAFTEDLMIGVRIQDAAQKMGMVVEIISAPEEIHADGPPADRGIPLTEPLEGPDAVFIDQVVHRITRLLIFDLTSSNTPWARWIKVLKTSAATRRIPVLAFGPHVDKEILEIAKRNGADEVISRGQFVRSIDQLLMKWIPAIDHGKIEEDCRGQVSQLCKEAIELHNLGQFHAAHEAFESAYFQAESTEGDLYRVLLQFSAVQLHLERENWRGARKMLLRVQAWLQWLPDICRGVDVGGLRSEVDQLYSGLVGVDQKAEPVPSSITELRPIVLQNRAE